MIGGPTRAASRSTFVHFNIRLEEERQCIRVVTGATTDGKKDLVAVQDGFRESEQSWKELLLGLKARGLSQGPERAVGDGALGFWKTLAQVFGTTREQRCWVHKTANVLNHLPKSKQGKAKGLLTSGWRIRKPFAYGWQFADGKTIGLDLTDLRVIILHLRLGATLL